MSIETRVHPRILVNWPTFIKTLQGSIAGETRDISVDGAFIFSPLEPALRQRYSIFLKPPGAESIRVIAETRWSSKLDTGDRTVFGMGVRFIVISPEDQQYIATVVEEGLSE